MSPARRQGRVPLALAAGLLLVFGTRAATGWIGGTAYAQGRKLADADLYAEALPLLARGAIGPDRAASRWLAGSLYLNLFQEAQLERSAADTELGRLLGEAYRAETEAISLSPASGWYWAALADVYHQVERKARYERGRPLELVGQEPWALVGTPGRVAVGLLREAIDREPTQYVFHDQLAFALLGYGLRDEALEVVRQSARVQPDFGQHLYLNLRPLPPGLLDAFAESSRAALGEVPLMPDAQHLLALAKVELRRGRPEAAEQDLRKVMTELATGINRSDAWFYLGEALEAQKRYPEAIEAYVRAAADGPFVAPGLATRARIAEQLGYPGAALGLLRRARRLQPNDLGFAMSYARVARRVGESGWAEEALRWAALTHGDDPRPLQELEVVLREKGETAAADEVRRSIEARLARRRQGS